MATTRPLFVFFLSAALGCTKDSTKENAAFVYTNDKTSPLDATEHVSLAPSSQKLLHSAALSGGLQLEKGAEALVLQYREVLLGNLFLEQYMSSRIVVTMDEIRDQYVTNRSTHQRKDDQVRVLHFLLRGVDEATSVKVDLLRYDPVVRSSLLQKHGVVPSTVSRGDVPEPLDQLLFGDSTPRGILGPVSSPFGFHVVDVLAFFPKNSPRGLDEVYDEISQSLYRVKWGLIYDHLIDSLSRAHPDITVNQD